MAPNRSRNSRSRSTQPKAPTTSQVTAIAVRIAVMLRW